MLYSARAYGFYSLSGNVGSRFGHAHDERIAISYSGEGTSAEGDFHEALTFAVVYRAPVILCVTNNQWAISSCYGIAGGEETTFAAKAIGYGIPRLRVGGNDFLAVHAATEWAAQRAPIGVQRSLSCLRIARKAIRPMTILPSIVRRTRPRAGRSVIPLSD